MARKEKFTKILVGAYSLIMVFYLLNSFSATFAFGDDLKDFYTLNFLPEYENTTFLKIIGYYLSLFPVFTISASFPVIGITLRNNLKSLYFLASKGANMSTDQLSPLQSYFVSIGLPLITLAPPLAISLITLDIQLLVGITGSYAGVAIQYVIPCLLVYFGRREAIRTFRCNWQGKHSYGSPFKSRYWVFFLLLWANISVIFVTLDHILN
jgi:hypothetical protein